MRHMRGAGHFCFNIRVMNALIIICFACMSNAQLLIRVFAAYLTGELLYTLPTVLDIEYLISNKRAVLDS
jgi:hypothetical protein